MPTDNDTSQQLGTTENIDRDVQAKVFPNKDKNLLSPKSENYLKTELKDIVSILEKNSNINNIPTSNVQTILHREASNFYEEKTLLS